MKLEQILLLWQEDSDINKSDLGNESLKIAKLHHKYYSIFVGERLSLRGLEAELKSLRHDKYEFYTQGPTRETQQRGWELPPIGKILRADVNQYLEADKDLINLSLKIGLAQEKVELLDSILRSLHNRGYQIKTALDFVKFQNGL